VKDIYGRRVEGLKVLGRLPDICTMKTSRGGGYREKISVERSESVRKSCHLRVTGRGMRELWSEIGGNPF